MKYSAILILFFIVTSAACSKYNYTAPLHVLTFSKEALKYVQLPLNRYFIYKDSATGVTDSVVVTKSDLYMQPYSFQSARLSGSSLTNLDSEQVFKLILTNPVGQVKWYDAETFAGFGFSIVDYMAPMLMLGKDNLLPSAVDRDSNYSYGFVYLDDPSQIVLQSLLIEGNTYNEVVVFTNTNRGDQDPNKPGYFKSTYYWAKNIGVIKRRVITSTGVTTCTLIKYGR